MGVERPPWQTPAVLGLAQQILFDRSPVLIPVLCDALTEAGAPEWLLKHLPEHCDWDCIFIKKILKGPYAW